MYHISTNQLAEFYRATEKGKSRILKQQVIPNKFLIPWYQLAKGAIKRFLKDVQDTSPLVDGIQKLKMKKDWNKRQLSDRNVSVESLERLIKLNISRGFKGIKYDVLKSSTKEIFIEGVRIHVSPDLIFSANISGQKVYGGVRIHVSKENAFDAYQCRLSSTLLAKFIDDNIAKEGERVSPSLCYTVDIFSNRIVSAEVDYSDEEEAIRRVCKEIVSFWPEMHE
jgi:hypothetical protein